MLPAPKLKDVSINLLDNAEMTYDQAMENIQKGGILNLYNSGTLDADETVYLGRELELILRKAYNILYPEIKTPYLIPIEAGVHPGADKATYESFNQAGNVTVISQDSNDFPLIEVFKTQNDTPIVSIGGGVQWSLQDIQAAAFALRGGLTSSSTESLPQRKIKALMREMQNKVERICINGESAAGLDGFFNNSDVPSVTIPANGTGNSTKLADKTAAQIIIDIESIINQVSIGSREIHKANTIVFNTKTWSTLKTRIVPNTTVSILGWLQENNKGVEFVSYPKIDFGVAAGMTRIFAYQKDPDIIAQIYPQAPIVLAPQQVGTLFRVYSYLRHGGVQYRYQRGAVQATISV